MNAFSHILVIVDPSAGKWQAAVDKAAILARQSAASVQLLICDIESARADALFMRQARATCPSNTQLLDLLDALAAPLRAQGIQVGVKLIYGKSLHQSLLEFIRASNADLVVKDTHHHSLARRTFLVHTDWYLARGSPVPLLLTKKKEWGRPPIVMAAIDPDRSKNGEDDSILKYAAAFAGRLSGDLHVIHTFVPTAFANAIMAGRVSMDREYSEAMQVENDYRCCLMERLTNPHGVKPGHLHVEMGTPKDGLVHRVTQNQGDILAIGPSSHGRWHRALVGSKTSTILDSMPCDILIISRRADSPGQELADDAFNRPMRSSAGGCES
jgi:universal stress protein E